MDQVTAHSEPVADFLVDPKGRYLITVHGVGGNESYDLYRYGLDSGDVVRLTQSGEADMCVPCGLSPDGATVFYTQTRNGRSEADLWRADVETGVATKVLLANGRMLECNSLSLDGRYVLFAVLFGRNERHLGVLDLNPGREHYIVREPAVNNLDAEFAEDWVYFRSAMGSDHFRLWQYKLGDTAPVLVKLPFDNDIEAFSLYARGRIALVSFRTELGSQTEVFIDGFVEPQRFGLPPKDIVGTVFHTHRLKPGIIFTENAATPRRFYLLDHDKPKLLYDSNQSGIDNKYFANALSLRVTSFDGLAIPTHLFIPNGISKGPPRPVIFWIHGGPDDHIDLLFINGVQALANRGFIIVAPNVRGSTGFGKIYSFLDDGDWGGGHIRDIVEVAKFVRSLNFVDSNNKFILGASFRGFSVMSLITQYPQLFKAAINLFGITELATFVDSWPPYLKSRLFAELGFDPRTEYQRNYAISPIYHADRIRIPLQVHQVANDRRVPKDQSDNLVKWMHHLGLMVEYYVYPDEGHGFERFENTLIAFNRMLTFLKRQLQ